MEPWDLTISNQDYEEWVALSCRNSWDTERRMMVECGQEGSVNSFLVNGCFFRASLNGAKEERWEVRAIAPHEGKVLLGTPCCFCCSFSIFFPSGICNLPSYLVEFSSSWYSRPRLSIKMPYPTWAIRWPKLGQSDSPQWDLNQQLKLISSSSNIWNDFHHFLPPGSLNLP